MTELKRTTTNNLTNIERSTVVKKWTIIKYLTYLSFTALDVLLVLRIAFTFIDASTKVPNSNADFVYGITTIFVIPFQEIFRLWLGQGATTVTFFDPAILVAIVVYPFAAQIIIRLTQIFNRQLQTELSA